MQADRKTIGKRIASRRKAEKIQQRVLAERIDISPTHLSQIENGKAAISFDLFCRICVVLNITPDYLLLGAMHSNPTPQKTVDKLRLCTESELSIIDTILEAFILQHASNNKFDII